MCVTAPSLPPPLLISPLYTDADSSGAVGSFLCDTLLKLTAAYTSAMFVMSGN